MKRELLQLEKKEPNQQCYNLIPSEKFPRHELFHEDEMLILSADCANPLNMYHHQAHQVQTEYRKSMPDLQTTVVSSTFILNNFFNILNYCNLLLLRSLFLMM